MMRTWNFPTKDRQVPLPCASARKLSHTRTVVYRCYDREDGLWDIEAELTDVKPYMFQVPNERPFPADEAIHHLCIRVTLDDDMLIHDITTSMDSIPHVECRGAPFNMHKFKGQRIGAGWRKRIHELVGGTAGCTHLRELLFNLATAAYQSLPSGQWHRRELRGQSHPVVQEPAFFLNQCHSWAYDSPTVQRSYPMFYRPKVVDQTHVPAHTSGSNAQDDTR